MLDSELATARHRQRSTGRRASSCGLCPILVLYCISTALHPDDDSTGRCTPYSVCCGADDLRTPSRTPTARSHSRSRPRSPLVATHTCAHSHGLATFAHHVACSTNLYSAKGMRVPDAAPNAHRRTARAQSMTNVFHQCEDATGPSIDPSGAVRVQEGGSVWCAASSFVKDFPGSGALIGPALGVCGLSRWDDPELHNRAARRRWPGVARTPHLRAPQTQCVDAGTWAGRRGEKLRRCGESLL